MKDIINNPNFVTNSLQNFNFNYKQYLDFFNIIKNLTEEKMNYKIYYIIYLINKIFQIIILIYFFKFFKEDKGLLLDIKDIIKTENKDFLLT